MIWIWMLQDWRREEGNLSMPLKPRLNSLVLYFIANKGIYVFIVNETRNVMENRTKWLKEEVLEV